MAARFGLLLCIGMLPAQIWVSGVLLDTTYAPIPFAILQNRTTLQGALSDLQGHFSLQANPTDTIEIRCVGYYSYRLLAAQMPDTIILYAQAVELAPVVIRPELNPAHILIQRLLEQRKRWDPLAHPHQYISYNKLTLSLPDSLQTDSLPPYVFLWETETEKIYFGPAKQQEKLLSQRIVGNLPVQSFLSPTAFQPISLYSTWLTLLDKRVASPVGAQAFSYYEYELQDTAFSGTDTLYQVYFFPRKGKEEWALTGYMVATFPDGALHSIQGKLSWHSLSSGLSRASALHLRQKYEKLGDTLWFPVQLHTEVGIEVRTQEGYIPFRVRSRSFLREIQIPPATKQISRAEVILPAELPPLRPDRRGEALLPEEEVSYRFLDSLLAHVPLRRIGWLLDFPTLATGRLPMGRLNLLLRPLLLYHEAEGVRPQIGIETNDKLSSWVRLRMWAGYGTAPWAGAQGTPWRYGADIEIGQLSLLRAFLYDDAREATLPRLLDESPNALVGEQRAYERPNRGYFLRWEDLVRERAIGFFLRMPLGNRIQGYLTAGKFHRIAHPLEWQGYQAVTGVEYLHQSSLLRRGSTTWRMDYEGPRLHLQTGVLLTETNLNRLIPWVQADLWHRWLSGRWAIMEIRLSSLFWGDTVPDLWTARLRTLSSTFLGLPHALAAHPIRQTTRQVVYAFYEWRIPNTRFPSPQWSPVPALHLQGAWSSSTLYPEIGFSVRNWVPQKLTRFLSSLSLTQIGAYTPLSARFPRERWYIRLSTQLF